MAGPTLQPKLFHTLLQFRTFPVALTGDICKMYRCVRVKAPDSDTPQEKIQVFNHDIVTYGTKPASFLSVRAMQQLAEDEKTSFPIGAKILLRDFYVDDLITGGNSTEEILEIMRQTIGLLDDPGTLKQIPDTE